MSPKKKRQVKSQSQGRRARKPYRPALNSRIPAKQDNSTCTIPNEVLSQILSRCDDTTLRNAMQTCRRWHAVINETIGVNVAIGKDCLTAVGRQHIPFQEIEVIENLGIKHCFVGDLTDVHGCPFKYPQTVRSLMFNGPITNFNLVTLLAPLPTLNHISFHYAALEMARLKHGTLRSVSLKSLRISTSLINHTYEWSKAVQVLQNITTLLHSIHSQQLQSLTLDLVYVPAYELRMTKALFTVLVRHKRTLKTVQCCNTVRLQEPVPPGEEGHQARGDFPLLKDDIINRAIKEGVHIKRICYTGPHDSESDFYWSQLITSQQSLEELFYSSKISPAGMSSLKMNATTLSKLMFHINSDGEMRSANIFDAGVFKSFRHLSHLLIRGRQFTFRNVEENTVRITLRSCVLKNMDLIPDTVQVFSLRGLLVDSESLSMCLAWFPNLVKFRLVDTGSSGEFGVLPQTLIALVKCSRLKEIEIIKSFNRTAWEVAIGKDIYEEALFYRIKDSWKFHASRSSSGVMHFKHGPMFDYGKEEITLTANEVCDVVFK